MGKCTFLLKAVEITLSQILLLYQEQVSTSPLQLTFELTQPLAETLFWQEKKALWQKNQIFINRKKSSVIGASSYVLWSHSTMGRAFWPPASHIVAQVFQEWCQNTESGTLHHVNQKTKTSKKFSTFLMQVKFELFLKPCSEKTTGRKIVLWRYM